jgi:hypothetical protein
MLDSLSLVNAGPVLMFLREACREHARGQTNRATEIHRKVPDMMASVELFGLVMDLARF